MKLDKIVLIRILGVVVVAIIILSVFFVSHRINNDNITYNKIVSYVSDNYEMLENFSYSEIEKIKSSNDKPEIRKQKEEEICVADRCRLQDIYVDSGCSGTTFRPHTFAPHRQLLSSNPPSPLVFLLYCV